MQDALYLFKPMQLLLFSSSETTDIKECFSLEAIFEAYFSCRSNKRNTINALAFELKSLSLRFLLLDGFSILTTNEKNQQDEDELSQHLLFFEWLYTLNKYPPKQVEY